MNENLASNGDVNGSKRKLLETDLPGAQENATSQMNQTSAPSGEILLEPASAGQSTFGREGSPLGSSTWQTADGRATKKRKKVPKTDSANYPSITYSNNARLQTMTKISDLQNLVMYIMTDGPAVQFVSVKHRPEIRKVVVLMVPGLEASMFTCQPANGGMSNAANPKRPIDHSPDSWYPTSLVRQNIPDNLQPWADMFTHIWPIKTPGDDKFNKMHSPLHAMLTVPVEQSRKDRKKGVQKVQEPQGWKNRRTPITHFLLSNEDLIDNDYTMHPACCETDVERDALLSSRITGNTTAEHGWVDTTILSASDGVVADKDIESGSLLAGRKVYALDCEMCMTGENEFSLTRISMVSWDGTVVLDELVKPEKPITDYVTR